MSKTGGDGGLAPEICTTSGSPSWQRWHPAWFHSCQRVVFAAVRAAVGKAYGAIEVAGAVDFYDGQAGMLHVVGAKPAVVGAAVVHFAVEALRHFGFFHKHFAPEAVVFGIVADEHALHAVVGTPFVHIDLVVFKHDFGFYLLEAGAAHGGGGVVEW